MRDRSDAPDLPRHRVVDPRPHGERPDRRARYSTAAAASSSCGAAYGRRRRCSRRPFRRERELASTSARAKASIEVSGCLACTERDSDGARGQVNGVRRLSSHRFTRAGRSLGRRQEGVRMVVLRWVMRILATLAVLVGLVFVGARLHDGPSGRSRAVRWRAAPSSPSPSPIGRSRPTSPRSSSSSRRNRNRGRPGSWCTTGRPTCRRRSSSRPEDVASGGPRRRTRDAPHRRQALSGDAHQGRGRDAGRSAFATSRSRSIRPVPRARSGCSAVTSRPPAPS